MPTWEPIALIMLLFLSVLGISLLGARLAELRSRMSSDLWRVEAKLDLLLKHANLEFDAYADLPKDVIDAARQGQTIRAIKLYTQARGGVGIKEAKDFIEELQRRAK